MPQNQSIPDLDQLPLSALLTYREVAAATGFSLSSVKRWAGTDRGPRMSRIGGLPRFTVRDVKAWLDTSNG